MTQNTIQTKATFKGHGKPEIFLYFEHGSAERGRVCRIRENGTALTLIDATGREIHRFGRNTKFWAAPVSE